MRAHVAAETAAEGDVASVRQDTMRDALVKRILALPMEIPGLGMTAGDVHIVDAARGQGEEVDQPPRGAPGAAGGDSRGLRGAWRGGDTAAAGPCVVP